VTDEAHWEGANDLQRKTSVVSTDAADVELVTFRTTQGDAHGGDTATSAFTSDHGLYVTDVMKEPDPL
jgi:hypothetical protein